MAGLGLHVRLIGLSIAMTCAAPLGAWAASWDHAHGDAANSGFLDLATSPARTPLAVIGGLGGFAPGVGPIVGPDGTVYLASTDGVLRARHPDGSAYWQRAADTAGEAFLAPPVVDSDGSIYAVTTKRYTDHRVTPAVTRREARLYRFTPGGGIGWAATLPDHGSIVRGPDLGTVSAPPNILHQGDATTVLVPVAYRGLSDTELRLVAFQSGTGTVIGDTLLGIEHDEVFGGDGHPDWFKVVCMLPPWAYCLLPPIGFQPSAATDSPDLLPPNIGQPMPGVAITGTDIVATDIFRSVLHLGFDPATGFVVRSRLDRPGMVALTAATVLPNGESVTGETDMHVDDEHGLVVDGGHLLFTGPLETQVADLLVPTSMPAHTGDGRIVFAEYGGLFTLDGQTPLASVGYPAATIASPAISRNEIYVSTASSLRSYDPASLALRGAFAWSGGGLSSPAIGPTGRIYAIASNQLFVWAAPLCVEKPSSPLCHVALPTHLHPLPSLSGQVR